jgi:hypothetical protein
LNAKGQIQPALDSSIFEQKESKAIGHLIEEVARVQSPAPVAPEL